MLYGNHRRLGLITQVHGQVPKTHQHLTANSSTQNPSLTLAKLIPAQKEKSLPSLVLISPTGSLRDSSLAQSRCSYTRSPRQHCFPELHCTMQRLQLTLNCLRDTRHSFVPRVSPALLTPLRDVSCQLTLSHCRQHRALSSQLWACRSFNSAIHQSTYLIHSAHSCYY